MRWLLLVALVVCPWVSRGWWLPWFGTYLMKAGPPVKADIAVVLAGDSWGGRISKAGDLVRDGYVPLALVSGPDGLYGRYESDLAIDFAERKGYPRKYFAAFPNQGRSTRDETVLFVPELRKRGVRRYLLVTSDTHTRRAAKIFRQAAPDIEVVAVAAPSHLFEPLKWWQEREGQKAVLFEWLKTVAGWGGF